MKSAQWLFERRALVYFYCMEHAKDFTRVEKILTEISAILELATPASVEKLKSYVSVEPKENQIYATLELMADQNYCLTYNCFYVKEVDGKKILDIEYATNENAEQSFIPELDEYATKVFDGVDYTTAEEEKFGPLQSKMLFEWFAKCWKIAGGEQSKVPTFFAMNKEYMCQDLTTGEIFTEEEAAHRLGHDVVV